MPVTLSDAVDDLLKRKKQDPNRLDLLATYCTEALDRAGLRGAREGKAKEVGIRGFGRQKDWDLAFVLEKKPRLLISLKSILENLAGTVPNRLDDLMGEAANVQQLSPEIVIGYVVIVDDAKDKTRRDGKTWADHFEAQLTKIAIRKAPLWNQGLLEGAWLIRINTSRPSGERVSAPRDTDIKGVAFFRSLVDELYLREPTLRPKEEPTILPAIRDSGEMDLAAEEEAQYRTRKRRPKR